MWWATRKSAGIQSVWKKAALSNIHLSRSSGNTGSAPGENIVYRGFEGVDQGVDKEKDTHMMQ
jgi:hypothetical protein